MTWGEWATLGAIAIGLLAIFLARRAAGRKRMEAISAAIASARASALAQARLEFVQVQQLSARATAQNTVVMGDDRRASVDRAGEDGSIRVGSGDHPGSVPLDAGEVTYDGGADWRSVDDGSGALVAGSGLASGHGALPEGMIALPDSVREVMSKMSLEEAQAILADTDPEVLRGFDLPRSRDDS